MFEIFKSKFSKGALYNLGYIYEEQRRFADVPNTLTGVCGLSLSLSLSPTERERDVLRLNVFQGPFLREKNKKRKFKQDLQKKTKKRKFKRKFKQAIQCFNEAARGVPFDGTWTFRSLIFFCVCEKLSGPDESTLPHFDVAKNDKARLALVFQKNTRRSFSLVPGNGLEYFAKRVLDTKRE